MAQVRAVRVLIVGRVQGVGFRAWTAEVARLLGLSGWVRNRVAGDTRAGDVEAVFSGPPEAVDSMLADCRSGPSQARVTGVRVIAEVSPVSGGFKVRADV